MKWDIFKAVSTALLWWLLTLPLDLVGLFVVPFVIMGKGAWRWTWLWYNDEDGLAPRWYLDEHAGRPTWLNQYIWLALRNRTSNLRWLVGGVKGEVVTWSVGRHMFWKNRWMILWYYPWKDGKRFTSFGARINKPWSDTGINFTARLVGIIQ